MVMCWWLELPPPQKKKFLVNHVCSLHAWVLYIFSGSKFSGCVPLQYVIYFICSQNAHVYIYHKYCAFFSLLLSYKILAIISVKNMFKYKHEMI